MRHLREMPVYGTKSFDNYRDLSQPAGMDAGFQFEFFCECCGDAWCTKKKAYRKGRVWEQLSKAAGVCGGTIARAGRALEAHARAGWRSARWAALKEAASQAQSHFRCCSGCRRHVCARCAGSCNGICSRCVASTGVTPVLRARKKLQALPRIAMVEGVARAR